MDIEILSGVGAIASSLFGFSFVREGEIGCVTTFGKASRKNNKIKLIDSGFKFVIPFIQKINKIHIRKNTSRFENLQITLKNGVSYQFDSYIVYHVKNDPDSIENILFGLEDYNEFVNVIFDKYTQQVLQKIEVLNPEYINTTLNQLMKNALNSEGIILDECGLVNFTGTKESQALLGIQYKLQIAEKFGKPSQNVLAAILGATPVINIEEKEQKNDQSNNNT